MSTVDLVKIEYALIRASWVALLVETPPAM